MRAEFPYEQGSQKGQAAVKITELLIQYRADPANNLPLYLKVIIKQRYLLCYLKYPQKIKSQDKKKYNFHPSVFVLFDHSAISSVNEVLASFIFASIVIFCSVSILGFMQHHRDAIARADCQFIFKMPPLLCFFFN